MAESKHAGGVDVYVDDPDVYVDVVRTPKSIADVILPKYKPIADVVTSRNKVTVDVVTDVGQGPPGEDGEPGPPGPAGGTYRHVQAAPAIVWTINHHLGYNPSITVVDSGYNVVDGDVEYTVDGQVVTLRFSGAFSGEAFAS